MWRRSEWPRMTWVTPNSLSIGADTSPVKAPRSSKCMFCAPNAINAPASVCHAAGMSTAGGAIRTSRSRARAAASRSISLRNAASSARASSAVRFIFQLPAISILRIAVFPASAFQRLDPRQDPAFEILQRRAPAGRDVREAAGPRCMRQRCRGVSTTDDRPYALSVGERLADRKGAVRELGQFEESQRAVPDNGLGACDLALEPLDGGGPDIQSHQVAWNVGHGAGKRAGLGRGSHHVVARQHDADAFTLGFGNQVTREFEFVFLDA